MLLFLVISTFNDRNEENLDYKTRNDCVSIRSEKLAEKLFLIIIFFFTSYFFMVNRKASVIRDETLRDMYPYNSAGSRENKEKSAW